MIKPSWEALERLPHAILSHSNLFSLQSKRSLTRF
jgi:hypothetical protein